MAACWLSCTTYHTVPVPVLHHAAAVHHAVAVRFVEVHRAEVQRAELVYLCQQLVPVVVSAASVQSAALHNSTRTTR